MQTRIQLHYRRSTHSAQLSGCAEMDFMDRELRRILKQHQLIFQAKPRTVHNSVVLTAPSVAGWRWNGSASICLQLSDGTGENHTGSWRTCFSPSSSCHHSPSYRQNHYYPRMPEGAEDRILAETHPICSPALMGLLEKKAILGKRWSWCTVKTLTAIRLGSHIWLMKRPMLP